VVLRIGSDRFYSIETLAELIAKFADAKVAIAKLTPPEGRLTVAVNAGNVIEVEAGNPKIYHERARAVLVFSPRVRLAVRETEAEVRAALDAAKGSMSARPIAALRRPARGSRRAEAGR
jgi:predicted outer membrane protein